MKTDGNSITWSTWSPPIAATGAAYCLSSSWPAWAAMWSLALGMYVGFKWMTVRDLPGLAARANRIRRWCYLWLWPGMDASAFFRVNDNAPRLRDWLVSAGQCGLGCLLIGLSTAASGVHFLVAGWCAMAGILLALHCGLIRLLALLWRRAGADVAPIMNQPLAARTVSDFWSRRWNLAFRDLAHRFVFRPVARRCGARWAMVSVFLFSGAVHEVGISLPARAGWGGPTMYFALQSVGVLLQHSRAGRRWSLDRGAAGRLFAWCCVVGPAGLLFHAPFIERVVLPFVHALLGVVR